jgi:hypothetical protein
MPVTSGQPALTERKPTLQASFKDRLTALCGYGAQNDFAEAAGIHFTNLSKQISKGEVDPTLCAHLEWMETTPLAKWPDRWSKLRDRAKARAKKEAKAA